MAPKWNVLTRPVVLVFSAIIIGGSLLYSYYLSTQLKANETRLADLHQRVTEFMATNPWDQPEGSSQALAFLAQTVNAQSDSLVPKILVGEYGQIVGYVLADRSTGDSSKDSLLARRLLSDWQKTMKPVKVEFDKDRYNYVYYGESALLRQLRWFPLVQMLVAITFILTVFYSFAAAKRSEQNRVWVGLAKETAHQLGTPVSSLMAWIELMKDRGMMRPDDEEVIREMEEDVQRLERIAERFSKIGSTPDLNDVSLDALIDRSAEYVSRRMSQRGKVQLIVNKRFVSGAQLRGNPLLLDWVIENLLKNALDSLHGEEGMITLEAGEKGNQFYIDVTDTGKGIPKANFRKVFEPGFTTKKRGWGLGLSLSKRIVEEYHKGKIYVKQSEPDHGATFRVLLPKARKTTLLSKAKA
jgi:two-component sensor histidine kinase